MATTFWKGNMNAQDLRIVFSLKCSIPDTFTLSFFCRGQLESLCHVVEVRHRCGSPQSPSDILGKRQTLPEAHLCCSEMTDLDPNLSAGLPTRKRQKLSHLSLQEKAVRRKIKNRVAAQIARNRRKAKMVELERQVLELELENRKLRVANGSLREKATNLLAENKVLRKKLCLDNSKDKMLSNGNEVGFPGPFALPATQGPPSVKQEALNKQIHTDHIYAKPVEEVNCRASESNNEKVDGATFPVSELAPKNGPEEASIARFNELSQADDGLFSGTPTIVEKEAGLPDAYSDSEWSRSPFSRASSPLRAWSSWDDVFADELFTQLISV